MHKVFLTANLDASLFAWTIFSFHHSRLFSRSFLTSRSLTNSSLLASFNSSAQFVLLSWGTSAWLRNQLARLSKVLLCNLWLQSPCLSFARRFAAMYRILQNTPATASAVPPDRHRGDNQTKSAHQTCSNAADTESIKNCKLQTE